MKWDKCSACTGITVTVLTILGLAGLGTLVFFGLVNPVTETMNCDVVNADGTDIGDAIDTLATDQMNFIASCIGYGSTMLSVGVSAAILVGYSSVCELNTKGVVSLAFIFFALTVAFLVGSGTAGFLANDPFSSDTIAQAQLENFKVTGHELGNDFQSLFDTGAEPGVDGVPGKPGLNITHEWSDAGAGADGPDGGGEATDAATNNAGTPATELDLPSAQEAALKLQISQLDGQLEALQSTLGNLKSQITRRRLAETSSRHQIVSQATLVVGLFLFFGLFYGMVKIARQARTKKPRRSELYTV